MTTDIQTALEGSLAETKSTWELAQFDSDNDGKPFRDRTPERFHTDTQPQPADLDWPNVSPEDQK